MRYLSVKVLPVVAALLLWAVATPADAAWILWANGPIDLSADQYEPRDYPVRSFLESSRCIQVLRGMEDGEPESYRMLQQYWPKFQGPHTTFTCLPDNAPGVAWTLWQDVSKRYSPVRSFLEPSLCIRAHRMMVDQGLRDGNSATFICLPDTILPGPQATNRSTPSGRSLADAGQGVGTIRYAPGHPIVAIVKLNGRTTARLVLDTGADFSVVKSELLAAAGVDLARPAARGKVIGVAGETGASYFRVIFETVGHRVQMPHVAALNTFDDDFADGLLGRDFLDRFKVVMDPAAGTITLVPR